MKMKSLGKILLIISLAFLCLLGLGVFLLLLILPSPYTIKEWLKLDPNPSSKMTAVHGQHSPGHQTNASRADTRVGGIEKSENESGQVTAVTTVSTKEKSQLAFDALIDSTRPLSHVCRTLGGIKNRQIGKLDSVELPGART